MPYGVLKVDTITFTDGGVDKSIAISGLTQNPTFTGNVTVTGTVSGNIIQGGTTVSGLTVTGTTANFASGVYTTQISGAIVKVPAGTAGVPTIQVGTGASVAPGLYSAGTDQLGISIGGASAIIVDSVGQLRIISAGSAAAPAIIAGNDLNTGLYSPGADTLALSTNGTERIRVDSSGRLLVGTSTAFATNAISNAITSYTQFTGTSIATASTLNTYWANNVTGSAVNQLAKSRGTLGVHTVVQSGDRLGAYSFAGSDGTNFIESARIEAQVDDAPGLNDMPGRLVFSTTADGASSPTERLRITSAGRVGIGTTNPDTKLNVVQSSTGRAWSSLPGQSDLLVERNGNVGLALVGGTSSASSVNFGDTDDENAGFITYYHDVDALAFRTGGLGEDVRIDSSGRLLLGTSTALGVATATASDFEIETTGIAISTVRNTVDSIGGLIVLGKSRGTTSGSLTAVIDNDILGEFRFAGADGTTRNSYGAAIQCRVDGTPGTNDMPGRLVFSTTADGASTPTERMRIDNQGRISIGSAGTSSSTNLYIARNPTGTLTQYGIYSDGVVQSDVTSVNSYFTTSGRTAAAAFTLTSLHHFLSTQSTIGAGSTVTNQYGFFADSSLTGATNNYGFYSNISSGVNRWNFYANGTATNYFAGSIGIGKNSPVEKLEVRDGNIGLDSAGSAVGDRTTERFYKRTDNGSTNGMAAIGMNGVGTNGFLGEIKFYTGTSDVFNTALAERARIDSSGRLLVGTSSSRSIGGADRAVQIEGTSGSNTHLTVTRNSADVNAPFIGLLKTRGTTTGAVTAVVDNDELGKLGYYGTDGTSALQGAQISAYIDGGVGLNDLPTRVTIAVTADGTSSPVEQWRISNGGTVIYNQPAPAAVDTTATLTVANLTAKIITSSTAAAVTMTLPLGTSMDTGFSGLYVNMSFEWSVINTGATNAVTVQANTGHTIVGTATVAASNAGRFLSRRTAANTWVTYRLSS